MDGPAPAWHGGSTFALPADAESAVLVGRVWDPAVNGPSPVVVRDGEVLDVSAHFTTVRDLCELPDPVAAVRAAAGPRLGSLDELVEGTAGAVPGRPRLLAPDRPAGGQGGRRHVRRVDARTRHRGAGQGRPRGRPRGPAPQSATRSAPTCAPCARARPRPPTLKTLLVGAGPVEPVPGGRHRPGRGDLHQGPGAVRRRHRRPRRRARRVAVEQPRARGRPGRAVRAAASSAPRSATTSTCATSRADPPCCCRRRRTTTPPAPSDRSSGSSTSLRPRRRPRATVSLEVVGRGRVPSGGGLGDEPRSAGTPRSWSPS